MMIALVNASCSDDFRGRFRCAPVPLGLQYLAGYIREKEPNLKINLLDGITDGYSRTEKKLMSMKPDLIGLSFTTCQANGAFGLMRQIRSRFRRVPIIVGGAHPTALPEDPIKNSFADISVVGEGEKTLMELIDLYRKSGVYNAEDLKSVSGIYFRNGARIEQTPPRPEISNIDSIPMPARALPATTYRSAFHRRIIAPIITFRQSVTQHPQGVEPHDAPQARFRATGCVLDEINELRALQKVTELVLYSSPFDLHESHAFGFCDALIENQIDICWRAEITPAKIPEELLRVMRECGCFYISFQVPDPFYTPGEFHPAGRFIDRLTGDLEIVKRYGFHVHAFFSLFNTWQDGDFSRMDDKETCETLLNAAETLHEKNLIDSLDFSFATPFPGTVQYGIAARQRWLAREKPVSWQKWCGESPVLDLRGYTPADVDSIIRKAKRLGKKRLFYRFAQFFSSSRKNC